MGVLVYEKNYQKLVTSSPMHRMWPTLVFKGLLHCDHLHQKITSATTDTEKAVVLLNSMKSDVRLEGTTFHTFLEALDEFSKETNDTTMKKLVEDMYNGSNRSCVSTIFKAEVTCNGIATNHIVPL